MLKKVLFMAVSLLFVLGAYATDDKGAQLTFEKPRHDYGTQYVDSMPDTKLDIKFTNTGDAPLVLSNVRACCGTQVKSWPKEPIPPGEEGVIQIEFRLAPRPQRISRTVTVNYNNEESPTVIFRVVGEIVNRE